MLHFFAITLLPLWLAYILIRRHLPELNKATRAGLALLLPVLLISWLTLLLSIWLHPTSALSVVMLLVVVLTIVVAVTRSARVSQDFASRRQVVLNTIKRHYTVLIPSGVLLVLLSVLLYTHSAQMLQDGWYSAGSSWGDLPLHLTYINNFARQEKLSLISPLFSEMNTTYPFLLDWYTSILVRAGNTIQTALIVSQLQVFAAMVALLLGLIRVTTNKKIVSIFTLLLFFCGGGLGFLYFFGDWQASGFPVGLFLQNQPWQFTNMADRGVFFSTIIPDILLPQRGFSVGISVLLAAVTLFLVYAKQAKNTLHLLLGGVLIGLVPFFHAHSFLWAAGLWLVLCTYLGWKRPEARRPLLYSMLLLISLALPQLWWFSHNGVGSQFLYWQPGWMLTFRVTQTWFELLRGFFLNFGFTAIVLIVLPLRVHRIFKTKPLLALTLGYSWVVFTACLFVSFQPWPWDNSKFMMLSLVFLCLYAALELANLWRSWWKLAVIGILIVATTSGTLSIIRELTLHSRLISTAELRMTDELRMLLEPGGITLTADTHTHPIPMIVGQPIVMGYRGWLWTHGIDYAPTAHAVELMYRGGQQSEALVDEYNVRYVYVSDLERAQYDINEEYWEATHEKIYTENDVSVFDVQN